MMTTRAPRRRGRSLWRTLLPLTILLAVGVTAIILRSLSGSVQPTSPIPTDFHAPLAALVRSTSSDGENGFADLAAALDEIHWMLHSDVDGVEAVSDLGRSILSFERVRRGPFEPDALHRERLLLERIHESGVIVRIDAALSNVRVVREDYGGPETPIQELLLPELAQTRELSKMNAAMMRIAAHEGDDESFIAALNRTLLLAQAIAGEPFAISFLVATDSDQMVLDEACWAVEESRLDDHTLVRALECVDAHSILGDLSVVIEGERLAVLEAIARFHSSGRRGDGEFLVDEYFEATHDLWKDQYKIMQLNGEKCPTRRETTRVANAHYDSVLAFAAMPPRTRALEQVDPSQAVVDLPWKYFFLKTMLIPLDRVTWTRDQYEMKRQATRIILALARFRIAHGDWPDSLEQLAPRFIDSVPADPISDRAFVYVKRRPTDEEPRPFWLYSCGLDGVDNGGHEAADPAEANRALRTPRTRATGLDYLVNRVRPSRD